MPVISQGRLGNRTTYRFRWAEPAVARKVAENVLSDIESFAALLEGYLRSELHVWTGEMRDRAYVEVDTKGDTILIRAGSDAEHTFWHEVRYHPQLRQAMDIWAPKLAATIRAALRRSV